MYDRLSEYLKTFFNVISSKPTSSSLSIVYENPVSKCLLQSRVYISGSKLIIYEDNMPETDYTSTVIIRRIFYKHVVAFFKEHPNTRLQIMTGQLKIHHLEPREDNHSFVRKFSLKCHLESQINWHRLGFYITLVISLIFFALSVTFYIKIGDYMLSFVILTFSTLAFGLATSPIRFVKNQWMIQKYKPYL